MKKTTSALLLGAMVLVVAPGCTRGDRASALPVDATLARAANELQLVREDGDPRHYTRAEELLDALPDDHVGVLVARGTLALARHDFAGARAIARRAITVSPQNAAALGVAVDAANELGQYDDALDLTQQMVDLRPSLASLSRVSYARELRGDLSGAIEAMTQAVAAGAANRENVAYTQLQLAGLLLSSGDVDAASAVTDEALTALPGFAPLQVMRARVLIARDHIADALPVLDHVLDVQPTAEAAILRADGLRALGRDTSAAERLVDAIAALYRANGVNTDLEMALHRADLQPGKDAVDAARDALAARPSTLGHDVLAWSLHRAGDDDGASEEIAEALALGGRDPQLRFHAAVIAHAAGDDDAARDHLRIVLDGNPRFSPLWTDATFDLARELRIS